MLFLLLISQVWSFLCSPLWAAQLDGIRFNDYKDFETKWNLVTVRYRQDGGELRYVYANKTAWNDLKSKKKEFSPGAVLAKIGMSLGDDPDFPSSLVPTLTNRVQVMVKDPKRFAKTNGWGYGLFDREGKDFPDEPGNNSQTCHACHTIVSKKDYVFSEYFSPFQNKKAKTEIHPFDPIRKLQFVKADASALPPLAKLALPKEIKNIHFVKGIDHVFSGTLNEMRPLLIKNAPAALISSDNSIFSVVYLNTAKIICADKEYIAIETLPGPTKNNQVTQTVICEK
jgi:hypothetical protein